MMFFIILNKKHHNSRKISFYCLSSNFFHLNAIVLKRIGGYVVKALRDRNGIMLKILSSVAKHDYQARQFHLVEVSKQVKTQSK